MAPKLKHGKENAISGSDLAEQLMCGSIKELQKYISQDRKAGAVILFTALGGYFLPDHGKKGCEEIREYLETVAARKLSTAAQRKALERLKAAYAASVKELESGGATNV